MKESLNIKLYEAHPYPAQKGTLVYDHYLTRLGYSIWYNRKNHRVYTRIFNESIETGAIKDLSQVKVTINSGYVIQMQTHEY